MRFCWAALTLILPVAGQINFEAPNVLTDHLGTPRIIKAFDLDQDGDLDLIGSEEYGPRIVWWLNDGQGNFSFGQEWVWKENLFAEVLALGDFNDDHLLDAMLEPYIEGNDGGSRIDIAYGKPDLGFEAPVELTALDNEFGNLGSNNIWNLNDDGYPDFYLNRQIYLSAGFTIGWTGLTWIEERQTTDGNYLRVNHPIIDPMKAGRESYAMGDLDGDGTRDLLVFSTFGGGRIEWFKITHADQPTAFSEWMTSQSATGHSASLAGDYDLDGFSNWEEFAFGMMLRTLG